jgi:hypothetical protein
MSQRGKVEDHETKTGPEEREQLVRSVLMPSAEERELVVVSVLVPSEQEGEAAHTAHMGESFRLRPSVDGGGGGGGSCTVVLQVGANLVSRCIRLNPKTILLNEGTQWIDVEGDSTGVLLEAKLHVTVEQETLSVDTGDAVHNDSRRRMITRIGTFFLAVFLLWKASVPKPFAVLASCVAIWCHVRMGTKHSKVASPPPPPPVVANYRGTVLACRVKTAYSSKRSEGKIDSMVASPAVPTTMAGEAGSFAGGAAAALPQPLCEDTYLYEAELQEGISKLLRAALDREGENGWTRAFSNQGVDGLLKTYENAYQGAPIFAYKGVLTIPCSVSNVMKVVTSDALKPSFDPNFDSAQRYHVYDDNTFVQHILYKTPWPLSPRDQCVVTAFRGIQFDANRNPTVMKWADVDTSRPHGAMVMTSSVTTSLCPESPGVVRGHNIGSGYVMISTGTRGNECQLNFVGALDMQFPSSLQKRVNRDKPMCCLLVKNVALEQFPTAN